MPRVLKEQFSALGTVVETENGKKIQLKSPAHYQTQVNKLPVGKKVHIEISTEELTKTQSQRNYYFVLVGYICDYNGDRKKDLHDWIMKEVFGVKHTTINGITHESRESMSDISNLTSSECMELIEYTKQLAGDLEVNIPSAEELGYISNY